jgi:hypothetical protein
MNVVPASRGVEWLKSAVETIKRAPLPFYLLGLVSLLLCIIPLVGFIVGAFMGGIQYATRKLDSGQQPEVGDLFVPVQQPGKFLNYLLLIVPILLVAVVFYILMFVLGGVIYSIGGQGSVAALVIGFLVISVLGLILGVAAYTTWFFAISRITFDNMSGIDAMKESFAAVMKNMGAFLTFIGVYVAAYIALVIVVMIPILGWLVGLAAFLALPLILPLFSIALYRAYQEVIGGVQGQQLPVPGGYAPPPPPGPPGPPQF